jgi:phage tail sheath gpL-like
MTGVAFNNIPGNTLVPFYYSEFNSGGTPYAGDARQLHLGQKTSAGAATAAVVYGPVQSELDAIAQFGKGSMLHAMYNIAKRNAPLQPFWALPLADPAGAAAAGAIAITAPAVTGAGVLRVMGRRIVVQVNAADTATVVAAAIVAAVNAANLPIVAAVNGVDDTKVDLTARHVGLLGNAIQVTVGTNEPNVLTTTNAAITALTAGTGTPVLDTPLANLGDEEFDWICGPYADTVSLDAIKDFLGDVSGRWSPSKMLFGHYITANYGTLSTQTSLGAGRNDPHVSILGSQTAPTPPWEVAAWLGALAVQHLSTAPELSRPLQFLPAVGVLPPLDRSTWFDTDDRQALYAAGIAGTRVTRDGTVQIDRLVTTYKTNAQAVADATFRDIETMAQGMFASRYFRSAVSNAHGRQALADDNPHNVATITTPKAIRNTLIHAYEDLVALGVTEKSDVFAKSVVVERDASNPNRVNAFIPADMVNQLRIFAANITAFLQYNTANGQAQVPAVV